jgi:hypothetical protein
MDHDERLWVVAMGTALHVLEEHNMDWTSWAQQTFGICCTQSGHWPAHGFGLQ